MSAKRRFADVSKEAERVSSTGFYYLLFDDIFVSELASTFVQALKNFVLGC